MINETVNAPQTPIAVVVPDDDDEVVVVSSSLPPVIDLCTPNNDVIPYRRSQVNRNELSRRNLERSEEIQHEVPIPIRRRRVSKPTPPPELDLSSEPEASAESSGESLDHTPFMCPVCMESCLKRKPTSTKCGHVFCEHCIKQSIRLTHKCPMCKTKLSCNQLIRIYV